MVNNYKSNIRAGLLVLLLFCTALSFGQTPQSYNNKGELQGVVRIKVTKPVATILKTAPLQTQRGIVTTGISAIDEVSKQSQATHLTRLFPENPNPRLEAKLRKHGLDLWYEVQINPNQDAAEVARQYQHLGDVTVAETERLKVLSNYTTIEKLGTINTLNTAPFNDPYLKDQWHYNNTGQTGYSGADINLFKAWEATAGSSDIIVSVHDEGIDIEHEDLKDNIWINEAELNGTDGVDDDGNGYIDDVYGWNFASRNNVIDPDPHGTHVAGTVSAVNNNGIGVSGVAGGTGNNDGVKIMSLKIIGGTSNAANSYIYAANNGAIISQNSWGYTVPGNTEQAVRDAINYFIAEAGDFPGSPMKGGIVVFAAGNDDYDAEWYPGFYPEVLTVSALGPEGIKASYSNFGTWVDIAAPGGNSGVYGSASGVLSTLPGDKIGYLDGTSMACPHISGIAALAIANETKQITADELLNKLLTGTRNIDHLNPDYIGKLGELSDAFLSIQNDLKIAPETITDLTVDGVSQEFATLSWTVPNDQDDTKPLSFELYYSENEITNENLASATKLTIKNTSDQGEKITYTVEDLYGLTTYHFAVLALDRWGNKSTLSNPVSGTTNSGPQINVDENSKAITIDVDAATNLLTGTHDINILNEAEGILKWEYEARHKTTSLSYNRTSAYQVKGKTKSATAAKVGMQELPGTKSKANAIPAPMQFEREILKYYYYESDIIGEEDLEVPNSSATKFMVNNEKGFNLTHVQAFLNFDPALGPVVIEIYKGEQLNKGNLIFSQEYTYYAHERHWAYAQLNEQLFFENGETFWVVFHAPSGNLYPLGIGPMLDPESNSFNYCFMSFDGGSTWSKLSDAINSEDFVWTTAAFSQNEYLGEYLTLDPESGQVSGNSDAITTLTADGSNLINGNYKANVILKSNDGKQPEYRLPVTLNVTNHEPELSAVSQLNFGSVFQGKEKELTFTLSNVGLGNFSNITVMSTNPQFELVGYAPWQIAAKQFVDVTVKYTPGANIGNDNGVLNITSSSTSKNAKVILFGVSTEPGKMVVTPEEQTVDNITIGDPVSAKITVKNEGASTLSYFIPNFDTNGISNDWEDSYSTAGYKVRTNHQGDTSPIDYEYEDISATGENITQYFKDNGNVYKTVELDFNFPYYKHQDLRTLYIARGGFTTFDNTYNPINSPTIGGAPWTPKGYISVLGTYVDLTDGGAVYYEMKPDRIIVQYDNINDGYWGNTISAQMVLFKNGNIRFYYNDVNFTEDVLSYLNILIEDYDQTEGILYNSFDKTQPIYTGMALGFDYPGPDIITSITNGSGVLLPGDSAELNINLSTDILSEGITNRYINIISNDPKSPQSIALVKLNVTDGGTPDVAISHTEIDFGSVFQGLKTSRQFVLNNKGNADATITDFTQSTNSFNITGETSGTIASSSILTFDVEFPTDVLGDFNDMVSITTDDGSTFNVNIKGSVIDPPAIDVDLTAISETLNHGEKASHELTITNPGKANLEVVASGNQWLSFGDQAKLSSNLPNLTYAVDTYNTGENYNWLDIRSPETQLPFITEDIFDPKEYYRTVNLTRPIQFYGEEYSTIFIAENGAIYFDMPSDVILSGETIPTEYTDKIIAPYWTFGSFNTLLFEPHEVGIFYTSDEFKTVISWEYIVDNFGGIGAPMSAQVIFYNNGSMKFQYKVNGNLDVASSYTLIGVQNNDKNDAVLISMKSRIPHGNGLAYILSPAEKQIIEPGKSFTGHINIDAGSVYAGTYNGNLKLRTNVPNQDTLDKPINLTVIGDAEISPSVDAIAFGSIMAYTTENGPKSYMRSFDITNTGVATLDLTAVTIQDTPEDYVLEMYVYDDWFGSWVWTNVNFVWNWPSLAPSETAKFRVTYAPKDAGEVSNTINITSSLHNLQLPLTATVILPPVLGLDTTEVYSTIATATGTDSQVATFNNAAGKGDLMFEVSLDYLRAPLKTSSVTTPETTESFANNKHLALHAKNAENNTIATNSVNDFENVLSHDSKTYPDTFMGFNGVTDFISGTRFNAGPNGFSLSHVQTYLKADELLEGTIDYEIRSGGTTISNATVIGSGSFNYSITDGVDAEIIGALNETFHFYPNEDFYIILTYPFELKFPQSVAYDVDYSAGRFTTLDSNKWYDLQEGYPDYGWMVRALEQTHTSNAWVVLQDVNNNTINIGASQDINLDFFAEFANPGVQHAQLVVKSNDPFNSVAQIPVTLNVNQAPSFETKPELIMVLEGETKMSSLMLKDYENDDISVSIANAPEWLTYTVNANTLNLELTPDYGTAGVYEVAVTLTDSNNAAATEMLNIEVMHSNRAPEALEVEDLYYKDLNVFDNQSFSRYFVDPDGDAMTYQITVEDPSIVTAFTSGDEFVIKTIAEGVTTLHIMATDAYGAVTEIDVMVYVGQNLSIGDQDKIDLNLFPNPATDVLNITSNITLDQVEVYNISGQIIISTDLDAVNKTDLDVSNLESGVYFVKAISKNKSSIFKFIKQ
ncbi:S8 family serine peptidase [Formosa haliotis]|uniref:S8 family serine peptidase n=1 Tax=Formosa haliotis TaxID=1555194 RepID=UPI0008261731|nr:S8 family serine peptidase [Formosa haliotis]